MIYNSLCISLLSYAITVWGSAPSSTLKRLNTLHKKGIRYVCNAAYNAHTDPLYLDNRILNLKDLFKLSCAKQAFKSKLGKLHPYHAEQIPLKSQSIDIETRQKHDIIIKKRSTNNSKINSINFKFGSTWNDLPFVIKDGYFRTVATFSKHIHMHYLSKYDQPCAIENCFACNRY